jgi:hypothetical protein
LAKYYLSPGDVVQIQYDDNGTWLGVFVNRKTDHFNHEKPSTSAICKLKINLKRPTIFTSKNRPVAKTHQHGRIAALERRIGQR